MIPISMKLEDWQTVLGCLAEAPFKVSAGLIQQIHQQANSHLQGIQQEERLRQEQSAVQVPKTNGSAGAMDHIDEKPPSTH